MFVCLFGWFYIKKAVNIHAKAKINKIMYINKKLK